MTLNKMPSKKLKKALIPVIIAIVFIIGIGIIVVNGINSKLSKDEQLVYQNVLTLKSMMNDGDSFELYDDIILMKHYNEYGNLDYTYTVFAYSGMNKHGTVDTAIFKDDRYIMNSNEELNENDGDYDEKRDIKKELSEVRFKVDYEKQIGDEWEFIEVDAAKIQKKLK